MSKKFDENVSNVRENIFHDLEEVERYANRKRDWHKNKGKRRIKDGYKEKYV